MRRIHLTKKFDNHCGMCGKIIFFDDKREWQPNDGDDSESIAGICFMTRNGDPVEAFDLCDNCIGKLYSKLIY